MFSKLREARSLLYRRQFLQVNTSSHFQHFSRSTRITHLCTAQISKFQQKSRHKFGKNECTNEYIHFQFIRIFAISKISRIFFGISRISAEISKWTFPSFIFNAPTEYPNSLRIPEKNETNCEISVQIPNLMSIFFRSE